MSTFRVCTATAAHLDNIMRIEHESFAPHICEQRAVFAERISVFPQGFFVLAGGAAHDAETVARAKTDKGAGTSKGAESESSTPIGIGAEPGAECETKTGNGARGILGYCSCEIWQSPKDGAFGYEHFALNHSIKSRHDVNGTALYVSSLAVSSACRGGGAGSALFAAAVDSLCSQYTHINRIVLLVCRSWRGAHRIYVKNGFVQTGVIPRFFANCSQTDGAVSGQTAALYQVATPTTQAAPIAQSESDGLIMEKRIR